MHEKPPIPRAPRAWLKPDFHQRNSPLTALFRVFVLTKGMGVVGPRPALPKEVATDTDYQRQRLLIKPGITCYWQTRKNRDSITFDEWIDLDLCNHSVPEQSLTVQEALRMCTYNGAWTTFDDAERGSLEVGKLADMCILSANPYTMEADCLDQLKVEELLLAGKAYKEQRQGFLSAVLKGVIGRNKI